MENWITELLVVLAWLLAVIFIGSAVAALRDVAASIQDIAKAIDHHAGAVRGLGPKPPAMSMSWMRPVSFRTNMDTGEVSSGPASSPDEPEIVFTERK